MSNGLRWGTSDTGSLNNFRLTSETSITTVTITTRSYSVGLKMLYRYTGDFNFPFIFQLTT